MFKKLLAAIFGRKPAQKRIITAREKMQGIPKTAHQRREMDRALEAVAKHDLSMIAHRDSPERRKRIETFNADIVNPANPVSPYYTHADVCNSHRVGSHHHTDSSSHSSHDSGSYDSGSSSSGGSSCD